MLTPSQSPVAVAVAARRRHRKSGAYVSLFATQARQKWHEIPGKQNTINMVCDHIRLIKKKYSGYEHGLRNLTAKRY